ncbi:unnamed protein product [Trichobilharzia szidati]|nr:unnamed protein product [Trichobilharzia szidati]
MSKYKAVLLHRHNFIRQLANKCERTYIPPPEKELTDLIWDDGLAITAQMYAKTCRNVIGTPHERTTCKWKSVGQNVAEVGEIQNAPVIWRDGSRYYDYKDDHCTKENDEYYCDSFKQMIFANTTHIGCGAHLCHEDVDSKKYIVVCNYAQA